MKRTLVSFFFVIGIAASALAQNKLSTTEKHGNWTLLFNGQNTAGWHTYLKPTAEDAWKVNNGVLQLDPKASGQGDLITDKEYENFELSVDWNISKEGNSGIIFGVHEDPALHNTYDSGIEMQVLDNKDAEDNKKANHLAGSLYDMKAPSADVAKPAGEWNTAKILKQNGDLTFYLNGKMIMHTKMGSPEWQQLIDNSKFKTWKNFAKFPKGHIALQDHGHEVEFRNIKIKTL